MEIVGEIRVMDIRREHEEVEETGGTQIFSNRSLRKQLELLKITKIIREKR